MSYSFKIRKSLLTLCSLHKDRCSRCNDGLRTVNQDASRFSKNGMFLENSEANDSPLLKPTCDVRSYNYNTNVTQILKG